ncbi:VOC family protein [Lentzea sp. NEAU-D13]|uniref:VOC family protein n=1 Tax=Lentzea alba TaxID=2714351 RepID=A0A7C9RTI3_9PSEU|nr:VOC family protein [Lentzea alba]NGY61523.1 VOC family protein [Lentzea alba]
MSRVKFELPADDLARATAFYRDVFGWSAQQLPFGYVLVDTDGEPVDPADSDGGISPRTEFVQGPVLIIEVPGIDDVARKVVDAGGALLNAKERVGDYGFSQYVKDSEGTVLCLWESIQDVASAT